MKPLFYARNVLIIEYTYLLSTIKKWSKKQKKCTRHALRVSTINYENSVNSDIKFNGIKTVTFNINQLDILNKMHAPENGYSTWRKAWNMVINFTISGGYNSSLLQKASWIADQVCCIQNIPHISNTDKKNRVWVHAHYIWIDSECYTRNVASLIEARREVTGDVETEGESPKDRTGDRGECHQRTKMPSGQRDGSCIFYRNCIQ